MIRRIELEPPHREPFAEPTPLGLIGLAVACAALVPVAFGYGGATPAGLKTAAVFALAFGAGAQLVAGLLNLANKNLLGGTVLTAFSFAWVLNGWVLWSLSEGLVPDPDVLFATEATFLVVFVVLTYGFGLFSKLLFYFLLDIDLMYAAKVANHLVGPSAALNLAVGVLTVGLGLLSLWIAFATLINPLAGRAVFKVPGPMFTPAPKTPHFDWSARKAIHEILYERFRASAFEPMPLPDLVREVEARIGARDLVPDLHYLAERGALVLGLGADGAIEHVRLNAPGIDLYEQLVLRKYEAA